MDESETKTCTNCKREIPAVNYTIHTVHCARNIKICPVCKEPVPQAELQQHHEKMHKLLPCKKCGESVCGTDLEDHIRDSCAHTIKSCRFCELELPRRELPAHEGYCGARTEQCPDCREWVMIKYRQLHRDSNHGFLRLDDDPVPVPTEPAKLPRVPRLSPPAATNGASTSAAASGTNGVLKNINVTQERPRTENRYNNFMVPAEPGKLPRVPRLSSPATNGASTSSAANGTNGVLKNINVTQESPRTENRQVQQSQAQFLRPSCPAFRGCAAANGTNGFLKNINVTQERPRTENSRPRPGTSTSTSSEPIAGGSRAPDARLPLKRTNDQPQINTNVSDAEKVKKELRPRTGSSLGPVAGGSRAPDARLPLKRTNDQPQINTNVSDAEKVKKELGMSRGAVKKRQAPQPPAPEPRRDRAYYSAMRRQQDEERARREQSAVNAAQGLPPVLSPAAKLERLRRMDALAAGMSSQEPRQRPYPSLCPRDHNFSNMTPMSADEFLQRVSSLNLEPIPEPPAAAPDLIAEGNHWQPRPPARLRGSGDRSWGSNGDRSSGSNGDRSSGSNGDRSTRSNGDRSMRSNGDRNLRSNGDRSSRNNGDLGNNENDARVGDRFNEIKFSLMALRRGLNEVTAPYNANVWNEEELNNRRRSSSSSADSNSNSNEEAVRLPCEFCARPVPLEDLVVHQTGCRPDLAQLKPRSQGRDPRSPRSPRDSRESREPREPLRERNPRREPPASLPPHPDDLPVIPCEFCTESLPVYLISEHQERCQREGPLLYPD